MKKYGSLGQKRVELIVDALVRCGAKVLGTPDPHSAPYEISIETPAGEVLDLVCYAFTAHKYKQGGRPSDEHRFQVKYGSDFDEYHELYFDPDGKKITLFFGVGIEEDEGIFVACDPAMHNPTWFSRTVEYKAHLVDDARENGWVGWERERSEARRKRIMPQESFEVEALVAFKPEHFLRYVQLERATTGLDPGERLLVLEQMSPASHQQPILTPDDIRRELQEELGYSSDDEILRFINNLGFRAKAALRGAAAENHLAQLLSQVPGVTSFAKMDEDAKPDFKVEFKRRRPIRIECKNVLRKTVASGAAIVDFQRTRASKGNPCSRYYHPSDFEILAACLHPVKRRWEYRFRSTASMKLGPKRECPEHLHHRPRVEGSGWTERLHDLLEVVTA